MGCVLPACWPYLTACTAARGVCPGGVCLGGMFASSLWGGCLPLVWGCLPLVQGGVCLWSLECVCVPACNGADSLPPWTDRHLRKHNLCKLRLRAVNMANCAVLSVHHYGWVFIPLNVTTVLTLRLQFCSSLISLQSGVPSQMSSCSMHSLSQNNTHWKIYQNI